MEDLLHMTLTVRWDVELKKSTSEAKNVFRVKGPK